jgi:histone-lysine N-methyltransferase SETD3
MTIEELLQNPISKYVNNYKIEKGEIIMKIPNSLLITLELARENYIGSKVSQLNLLSPKHCLLTSYILQEKIKSESKWKPYLDILPRSYDNFPIFYTEEELYLL